LYTQKFYYRDFIHNQVSKGYCQQRVSSQFWNRINNICLLIFKNQLFSCKPICDEVQSTHDFVLKIRMIFTSDQNTVIICEEKNIGKFFNIEWQIIDVNNK
jgi:hypothetical protein